MTTKCNKILLLQNFPPNLSSAPASTGLITMITTLKHAARGGTPLNRDTGMCGPEEPPPPFSYPPGRSQDPFTEFFQFSKSYLNSHTTNSCFKLQSLKNSREFSSLKHVKSLKSGQNSVYIPYYHNSVKKFSSLGS